MYYLLFFVTILAITFVERAEASNDAEEAVVNNMNNFGLWLANKSLTSGENFVFSPYSISKAMTVLHSGAKGDIREEIGKCFLSQFQNHSHDYYAAVKMVENKVNELNEDITFTSGSYGLFKASRLIPEFVFKAKEDHNTEILAFNKSNINEVVEQINREIRKSLHQTPTDESLTLNVPNPDTTVGLLYNYVHVKGNWASSFPVNDTKPGHFSWMEKNEKCQASIPMMQHTSDNFCYDITEKYKFLGIDFNGAGLAFFIILNINNFTLTDVLTELKDNNKLTNLVKYADIGRKIKATVPKFELVGNELDLKPYLIDYGIKQLAGDRSDVSGIVEGSTAYVSDIKQKAFLKIDENGAEAGGATSVGLGNRARQSDPLEFVVDRPFLFVIGHLQTGAVLFQGVYQKPQTSDAKCTVLDGN